MTIKNDTITVDMLFSYWLFLWFFLYILFSGSHKWIYKYLNPLLAFYFGLLENITVLIKLIYQGVNKTSIQFFLVIMVIKVIPIYLLQNHHINWKNDLTILLSLFLIYNLYLWFFKKTNLAEIYEETEKSIANDENRTPLLALINR
jgi:hypothetical protein